MRTISSSMLPDSVREIGTYGVVRKRLPVFTEHLDSEYLFHGHDVDLYGTGLYRAASISERLNSEPYLYVRDCQDLDSITIGLTDTGIELTPLSGVSVFGGYVFYHKANGDVVRREISSGTELVYFNHPSDVGLAAVSSTDLYVMYALSETTYTIRVHDSLGWAATWDGAVYGENIVPSLMDAERIDGIDHIVWQESSKRNARILHRLGDIWSDTELVFPLDVVDDTFQFRLGGVSNIDSRLVVVGTLVRNNSNLKIYTFGPEHFTLGREMFISNGKISDRVISGREVPSPIGKMLLVDDYLYVFGGDGRYHDAPSTILFGSDRSDQMVDVEITALSLSGQVNSAYRLMAEIKSSSTSPLIKSGSLFDWYGTINGVSARLGRFVIEAVTASRDTGGLSLNIIAQSLSMKNMGSWVSDSSFDYWSQTKHTTPATTLAEAIRGEGEWNEVGDYLQFDSFNVPGIIYTVEKASRNGTSVGEFMVEDQAGYSAKHGVAIIYHRETPQDAAARLGETFATNFEVLNHGVFFTVDSDTGDAAVSMVINDEWTTLETGTVPVPYDQFYWLRVDFHDGWIRAYYRTGTDWVQVIETRVLTDASHPFPWFSDDIGKACIYIENVTAHSDGYAFSSLDNFIPVKDVTPFPASGVVMVDDEYIEYDGVTSSLSLGTEDDPLIWVDGKTFPGIVTPHKNKSKFPDQRWVDITGTSHFRRGDAQQYIGGSFLAKDSWDVTSIEVYLKKMGSDPAWAEIWLGTDDSDNGYEPPAITIVAKSKRQFLSGATAYMQSGSGKFYGGEGWVRFAMSAKLRKGEAYWVYLVNDNGLNIPAGGYFNIANTDPTGTNKSIRYVYPHWEDLPQSMKMRVNGPGLGVKGYEIFMDTVGEELPVDHYDGCVLVCIDGPGQGRAMKIVGYDYYAPHQWVPDDLEDDDWESNVGNTRKGSWVDKLYRRFFVELDPRGAFAEGSKFIVVPALNVVNRGVADSAKTAHSSGIVSYVGLTDNIMSGASVKTFEYYSSERDMTLGWMLTEIAKKANVMDVFEEMRTSGTWSVQDDFDFTRSLLGSEEGETAIVNFDVSDWKLGGIGLAVFTPGDGSASGVNPVAVVVYEDHISYYERDNGSTVLLEDYPLSYPVEGRVTVSFQKDCFSVWNNGQYLTHFYWADSEAEEIEFYRGYRVGIINDGDITCEAEWSELDTRVDNFILDIGQAGLPLANELIGEKRVFMLDDQNGNLKLFRNRVEVNPGSPLDMQISQSENLVDTEIRTRLRSEGVEIAELVDLEALSEHGNLFALVGLREPNNIAESMRELKLISEDLLKTRSQIGLSSVIDPRVEPEDLLLVQTSKGYQFVRVSSIDVNVIGGENPLFDMSIMGSVWKESGVRAPTMTSSKNVTFTTGKEQVFTITTDGDPDAAIT